MRRLLILFMLFLLPLQVSWAAVCVYCEDQCIVERSGDAAAAPQPGDEQAVTGLAADSDCTCCQLGGIGVATAPLPAFADKLPRAAPVSVATVSIASIRPERPERPKWVRAA